MDAEAYPEQAINVVQILWDIGTTRRPGHECRWSKARASAFEALTHYEVISDGTFYYILLSIDLL